MDEANAKLAHQVGELRNTSGKGNAEIAITVVRLPPVAVHTLAVEIAETDEIAVWVQGRFLLRSSIRGNSPSC